MTRNSGPKKSKIVSLFITFLILFIVVFSLGVIIGKGLGGSDTPTIERSYDEEVYLEQPSESEITDEETLAQDSDIFEGESDELMDEETETLPDDPDEQSTTETEIAQAEDSADINAPSDEPQLNELAKESDSKSKEPPPLEVSIEKSPLEDQDNPTAKSAMPKIDPGGRYTVQIGAFKDQSQANKLLNSLKSKGYPVFIKQAGSPDNKPWYRVRVGTFSNRADAIS